MLTRAEKCDKIKKNTTEDNMFLSQSNGPMLHLYDTITETVGHLKKCGFSRFDVSFFSRFQKGSIYFSDDYMKVVDEYREAI